MNAWFSKKPQVDQEHTGILTTLEEVRRRRKEAMDALRRQLESVPKVDKVLEAIGDDLSGGTKK